MRVYGDYPLYNAGCLFRVSVGGEVSAWFFAANMEDPPPGQEGIYGGRLRGYVFGTALCIISARGDVTLELYQPGKNDVSTYSFEGTLWVAGGIGFCEPNEWTSWDDRWWNDSWCYTCGAMVSVDYNVNKRNEWDWSYNMECE